MLRKAIMVVTLLFMMGMMFSLSTSVDVLAQEDAGEPTLYEDTEFDEFFEEIEPILSEEEVTIDDVDYADPAELWALLVANFMIFCCVTIPFYIFLSLTLYTIGKKVGEDGAWMAWVPILNGYYMVKVGDLSGWMFLLFLVPFVNFFFGIYVWMQIFKRRGFNEWLALLMLVPVVNLIMLAWVAWGEGDSTPDAVKEAEEKVGEVADEAKEMIEDVKDGEK